MPIESCAAGWSGKDKAAMAETNLAQNIVEKERKRAIEGIIKANTTRE